MPLTSEVRRSPEPSTRPSAAADSEERQICTTCLFAESAGLRLCFLPSCAMSQRCWKRGSGDGQRLSLYELRLSDLSMPLKCEVLRSPVQSGRQPIARSGKFVRRAYSRRALDCEKDDGLNCMYAFSHRDHAAHFCLRGGWGKRRDLTWHPAVKHQRPAAKTTNSNCCDRAAAQVNQHIPKQSGWKKKQEVLRKYQKEIKLILKTIGNRKEDCAWSCSRWQTQPEKICKLQSPNQYNMRSEWHWFVRCDLQIFCNLSRFSDDCTPFFFNFEDHNYQ